MGNQPEQTQQKQDVKSIEDQLAAMSPEDLDAMLARIQGRK